jgi:D-3-phosphoglycerate dehydrogenase
MIKILVADPLAEEGMKKIKETPGISADVRPGLTEDELAACVGEYDGMIIRSGVKITAKVMEKPGKLRCIARAGVGVDNVDLEAATKAGILVMNTPDANTISTAEQTMALMLALTRKVAAADAHVRSGEWKRGQFTGLQLAGKTLGIVGFGRVGRAVAQRALAFDMKVLAFDPFFSGQTALDGKVTMVAKVEELFPKCDYLTLHTVASPETKGMINKSTIAKMKDGIRIVNCARGALINEADLAEALKSGKVSGAAIDVFASEPPAGSPLLAAPNTVLAPHLGASTEEAQLAVTTDAVDALLDYLVRDQIRWAVNVAGLPSQLSPRDKAYLDLARRMGVILSALSKEGIQSIQVTTHGESLGSLARTIAKQVTVDLLSPHFTSRLNLINVDASAQSRGIKVESTTDPAGTSERVYVKVTTRDGTHDIAGEIHQESQPRIMSIDGYRMNLVPAGQMVLIFNNDQPGVIGLVGTILGSRSINIADMMLSRQKNTALMVLKLDAPLPGSVREDLASKKPPLFSVLPMELPELGA